MTYASLTPTVREALAVSSAHDTVIQASIRRSASYMLKHYNFPKSVVRFTSPSIPIGATNVLLPVGFGKIKAVRLALRAGGVAPEFKHLHRCEEGTLPYVDGPAAYWIEGQELVLDTPMPEAGLVLEVWYQTINIDLAEVWLTTDYSDNLFNLSCVRAAPMVRKPEAQAIFSPLWAEDMQILAVFLNELEFNGMDLRMGSSSGTGFTERYPSV